ncbi:MAG: hypothetical protein V1838_01985 [Patescibacteria group bacterium]
MNGIEIIRIVGLGMDFFGAIFLSWGLIKSEEQVVDESLTYYGYNPFLTKYGKGQRRASLVGLCLLIIGFSLQLSSYITIYPEGSELFGAIALGTSVSLAGLLTVCVLYNYRKSKHAKIKEEQNKKTLIGVLKIYKDDLNKIQDEEFMDKKNSFIKEILRRNRRVNSAFGKSVEDFEVKVNQINNKQDLIGKIQAFIDQNE